MKPALYKTALALSYFTIAYNLSEGLIAMGLGFKDETLSLFGFGVDSMIEMVSGLGIMQMVLRIGRNPHSEVPGFEVTSLRITGYGFLVLAVGLVVGIIFNIIQHHTPETTIWGAVIALVSIVVMVLLYRAKIRVGRGLQSEPMLADASCTLICIYMSLVLLIASAVYELSLIHI